MPLTAPGTSDTMQRVLHFSKSACLQHAAYQRRGPQHLLCRHALKPRPPALNRQQHRCMAFYGGGGRDKRNDDPSLAEIGTELISKVKQLPGAIYTGLTNLANKIFPGREPKRKEPSRQQKSMLEGMFGGGIMGKMMENTLGRAVENLAKNAAEQLRATQQQSQQVQQKAAQAIESSMQLREYLGGGIQVAEPISESSSMQSVNGQVSQTVELVLPVLGSNGKVAHAQVQSSGQNHMDIQVQLPGGRLLKIDPHESAYEIDQDDDDFSQKGRVIDVDWREVR